MKLLLDEDVPAPLTELLKHLLRGHQVDHVYGIGWGGKKDVNLFPDAAKAGYHALLTNNLRQFNDPVECRAIQRSGLHHIGYELADGLDGLALATGAICAAIRPAIAALDKAKGQRIVRIRGLSVSAKRFTIKNPATDRPSAYWP